MRRIGAKLLDESFQTSLTGPSRDFEESSSNTSFAFGLALLLVYLVLAGQFESFTDPITTGREAMLNMYALITRRLTVLERPLIRN